MIICLHVCSYCTVTIQCPTSAKESDNFCLTDRPKAHTIHAWTPEATMNRGQPGSMIDAKLEDHRISASRRCPSCGHELDGKLVYILHIHARPRDSFLGCNNKFDLSSDTLFLGACPAVAVARRTWLGCLPASSSTRRTRS